MRSRHIISKIYQLFSQTSHIEKRTVALFQCLTKTQQITKLKGFDILSYSFSTTVNKKTVESPVQTIINYVDSLKDSTVKSTDIQRFHRQLSNPGLKKGQKTSLIKYFMSALYRADCPTQQLLQDPTLKKIQQNEQFVELETIMFIISRQMTSKTSNFDLINNLYMEAFNRIIPSVKDQIEKIKCEVLLYKNFGLYMVEHGTLEKGIVALERSIEAHKQLILNEFRRMESFSKMVHQNTEQNKKKPRVQKQRQTLQINSMKQNIRRLIESMFQVLHYYYIVRKTQLKSPVSQSQKQDILLTICTLIKQSMRVKTLIPGIQLYSRYYHRLKQIHLELEYSYALAKRDGQRVKDVRNLMKEFIKVSMDDLEEAKEYIEVQKEIAIGVFSVQLHLSRAEKGNDVEEIKRDLSGLGLKILEKGKLQQNQKAKQIITKLLREFIKKNVH